MKRGTPDLQTLETKHWKMSSIETYADFRVAFLHDENGGKLWEEDLFLNLYDFWVLRRDGIFIENVQNKKCVIKKDHS